MSAAPPAGGGPEPAVGEGGGSPRAGAGEALLLLLSLAACAALDPRAAALLALVSVTDHLVSRRLPLAATGRGRRALLLASVVVDVGLLLLWRVGPLLAGAAGVALGGPILGRGGVEVVIPIGVSFLALRSLGFVVDVYRGAAEPCRSWLRYALFLAFFPAWVAGPIARGAQLLPQLPGGIRVGWGSLVEGGSIFVQGLAKKLVLADRLAAVADPVFSSPQHFSPLATAVGVVAYSLQIYCDFSGYSDMAIGAARALGFDLPRNFDAPYAARSVAEFWHRWHVTLSLWLRDYVFLPCAYSASRRVGRLGLSSRWGELLTYGAASVLTMLAAGAWHGTGWGFLAWGAAHGVALAVQRVWQRGRKGRRSMPPALAWALTFLFVTLAWVPFRAGSVAGAANVLAQLVGLGPRRELTLIPGWLPVCVALVALGHLLTRWVEREAAASPRRLQPELLDLFGLGVSTAPLAGPYLVMRRVTTLGTLLIVALLLAIMVFSPSQPSPFVYATF